MGFIYAPGESRLIGFIYPRPLPLPITCSVNPRGVFRTVGYAPRASQVMGRQSLFARPAPAAYAECSAALV